MQDLTLYQQKPVLDLPADSLPEGCTRPYGQVLLLMFNEDDGSLHGPWAALPSANSPDQAAAQQVRLSFVWQLSGCMVHSKPHAHLAVATIGK